MEDEIFGYGRIALSALEIFKKEQYGPNECWMQAAYEIYPNSISSAEKVCPRYAFLGLCDEGMVIGIDKGNYTGSYKNKAYAVKAVKVLRQKNLNDIDPIGLWELLPIKHPLTHNHQMDVVLALWRNNLIVK